MVIAISHYKLDPELEQEIDEYVAGLPPLTPEQLDAVCDVLARIRLRAAEERPDHQEQESG